MSGPRIWRVLSLELAVGEPEKALRARVCAELGIPEDALGGWRIVRKALDARRRGDVRRLRFVVHAEFVLDAGFRSRAFARARRSGRVVQAPGAPEPKVERPHASLSGPARARIVVLGAGPGGLFAALVLARHGVEVLLLDRGSPVERRSRELVRFHRTRTPNPESNLLFGEGGAGTYSDGKLYTRVDDPLEHALLSELVAAGAREEILYDARAHIGTDRLHRILPALRARLAEAGVRFAWNTRVLGFRSEAAPNGGARRLVALASSAGEIPCDALIASPGHSARDTWQSLEAAGVVLEPKPFQLGIRVEHPQRIVDAAQHGEGPEAELCGAASYQLVAKPWGGLPSAHSFCMCPGGKIVASVSEPGYLCTNGMSNARHSSRWANAAIVVTLGPREYGPGTFAGVELQRALERRFFEAGGGDYTAPAQRVPDFVAGRESDALLRSSYTFGTRPGRLDLLIEPAMHAALARALERFERSIPGFAGPDGLLVGIETRSSGPVRITRDARTRRALGFTNLYPVGEGAGYAGGIMSAALDGARAALALLENGLE